MYVVCFLGLEKTTRETTTLQDRKKKTRLERPHGNQAGPSNRFACSPLRTLSQGVSNPRSMTSCVGRQKTGSTLFMFSYPNKLRPGRTEDGFVSRL